MIKNREGIKREKLKMCKVVKKITWQKKRCLFNQINEIFIFLPEDINVVKDISKSANIVTATKRIALRTLYKSSYFARLHNF